MILVFLEVNGKVLFAECGNKKVAKKTAKGWLLETKKSFPHKEFEPKYYQARAL